MLPIALLALSLMGLVDGQMMRLGIPDHCLPYVNQPQNEPHYEAPPPPPSPPPAKPIYMCFDTRYFSLLPPQCESNLMQYLNSPVPAYPPIVLTTEAPQANVPFSSSGGSTSHYDNPNIVGRAGSPPARRGDLTRYSMSPRGMPLGRIGGWGRKNAGFQHAQNSLALAGGILNTLQGQQQQPKPPDLPRPGIHLPNLDVVTSELTNAGITIDATQKGGGGIPSIGIGELQDVLNGLGPGEEVEIQAEIGSVPPAWLQPPSGGGGIATGVGIGEDYGTTGQGIAVSNAVGGQSSGIGIGGPEGGEGTGIGMTNGANGIASGLGISDGPGGTATGVGLGNGPGSVATGIAYSGRSGTTIVKRGTATGVGIGGANGGGTGIGIGGGTDPTGTGLGMGGAQGSGIGIGNGVNRHGTGLGVGTGKNGVGSGIGISTGPGGVGSGIGVGGNSGMGIGIGDAGGQGIAIGGNGQSRLSGSFGHGGGSGALGYGWGASFEL